MAILASETWTGADGAAWPAQFTTFVSGGGIADIQGNRGRMRTATAGAYASGVAARLTGTPARSDFDVTLDVNFPNSDEQYLSIYLRSSADATATATPSSGYKCLVIGDGRSDSLELSKTVGSTETVLAGGLVGGAFAAGQTRRVRIQLIGSSFRVKVWTPPAAEPGTWLSTVTDTAITGTGWVTFSFGSGADATADTVYLDDLTVTDGVTGPTSPLAATASATAAITGSKTISRALAATAAARATVAGSKTTTNAVVATAAATASASGTTTGLPVTSSLQATASATVTFLAVTPTVVPPAPVPDPIAAPDLPVRRMVVSVFTRDYTQRIGQVPNYISCSVTWQHLGVGSGTLVVGEDDPIAPSLLAVDEIVVGVVVDLGDVRWSGRVLSVMLEREGPLGSGVLTATLVDEWVWLQKMLASQNGANPALTTMPQFDTRTGPAASMAADFINASATRLGVPVRATKPSTDTSATVTIKARMTTLADLLTAPLRDAGVTMAASMWLPGDTQPPDIGTALTTPTVVFAPRVLADKPWLQWNDTMTNISKMVFQGIQPAAYRAIVGLGGTDAARVYDQLIDAVLQASVGAFGLPEIYTDASNAALGSQSQDAARQALAPLAGSASASFEVADANPFRFGPDFIVGDMATVVVSGGTWRQRITKVTVTDDRTGGLSFVPVIGDEAPDVTGDGMMVAALARVAEGLRALQAGR